VFTRKISGLKNAPIEVEHAAPSHRLALSRPTGGHAALSLAAGCLAQAVFFGRLPGLSHPTLLGHPQAVERLRSDPFYHLTFNPPRSQPGEHYRSVYQSAVLQAPPGQRLHLCHLNHLAFALLTGFRQAYLADLTWAFTQVKSAGALPALAAQPLQPFPSPCVDLW
jgi:hypothetical protein